MTDGTNAESYAYDAVGNRTASHLTGYYYHEAFNRMTLNYPWDIGYDNNGNMTSWMDGTIPLTTEVIGQRGWDRENRLTHVNASAIGEDVTYSYDALGRRVSRNESRETKFTYDGNDVVLDDDEGTLTKYQNALGIDNKLKQKKGSTTKYFLQDHLGSTVGLADSRSGITRPGKKLIQQVPWGRNNV